MRFWADKHIFVCKWNRQLSGKWWQTQRYKSKQHQLYCFEYTPGYKCKTTFYVVINKQAVQTDHIYITLICHVRNISLHGKQKKLNILNIHGNKGTSFPPIPMDVPPVSCLIIFKLFLAAAHLWNRGAQSLISRLENMSTAVVLRWIGSSFSWTGCSLLCFDMPPLSYAPLFCGIPQRSFGGPCLISNIHAAPGIN